MQAPPARFAQPHADPIPLAVTPRLASWMRADHPDRVQLEQWLKHAVGVLEPKLVDVVDALALRLDVGIPPGVPLLKAHDVDNYVFPLAMRLIKDTGRQLACVWATKRHAGTSLIGIEPAVARTDEEPADGWLHVHTTASSSSTAYKQQVHDAVRHAAELPEGPVALELSFTIGPSRNWPNLWKPTIDALGPLLGESARGRPWTPRDGRITELGLHQRIEPAIGNDVLIAIAARPQV